MNVSFCKTWRIPAVVVSDAYNGVRVNFYTITVNATTINQDSQQINLAYERLRFWLLDVLQDSFLINTENPCLEKFQATGGCVLLLPGEPAAQLLGVALFCKLCAIVENRISIDNVLITSDLDDDIIYSHEHNEDNTIIPHDDWWRDPGPGWQSKKSVRRRSDKVIALGRVAEWKDHDLAWNHDQNTVPALVTVFAKNEDQ